MKYKNKTKVFGMWTDWNRKGALGLYGGIGWYRIINPLKKLQSATLVGKFDLGGENRVKTAEYIKSKGDVMYIKYVDSFKAIMHMLAIRDSQGLKLVVDIDDNVFKVHPHNYAYKDTKPGSEAFRAFQYLFKEADALVCSTEPLAEDMKSYNDKVFVIPNSIDTEIWNVPLVKNTSEKIKIGWVYGPTHEQDVPVIIPAIKEILKKYPNVEFNHIGWKSEYFDHFNDSQQKMIFGTSGYKEFPKFLAGLGIDILIAPLIDDDFNKGKSNIKWMEAAMCEIPIICSDVYPYSNSITQGHDGYLAKTTSEWIKYFTLLIENKQKREEIGKNAKETVLKNYDVQKFLPKYVEVFEEVTKPEPKVTVVVTRRKGESDQVTLDTLAKQTYKNIRIIRVEDLFVKGANWARNLGFSQADSKYVLFSDNDIYWKSWAVKKLWKHILNVHIQLEHISGNGHKTERVKQT